MAVNLGEQFLNAALGPVNYAGRLIMNRKVSAGLAELTRENLMGAVDRGVVAVAKTVGVAKDDIDKLLPLPKLSELMRRIELNQRTAAEQWTVHTSHIGGLLSGIADLTADGREPDLALCVLRLSKRMQLDKALARPLASLAEDLDRWALLLRHCRYVIDNGEDLARAYRRRRRTRLLLLSAMAAIFGLGLSVVTTFFLARRRIDAALAAADPCSVEQLSASDVDKASGSQGAELDKRRKGCDEKRAAEERAAAERAEDEAQAQHQAKVREERARECDGFGRDLQGGAFDPKHNALAGKHAALLKRVADGALEPDDVTASIAGLPCHDTPSATRVEIAFARAVVASATTWLPLRVPSKEIIDLLSRHKRQMDDYGMQLLDHRIEEESRLAVISGRKPDLERAAGLCNLKATLGMERHEHCKIAQDLHAKGP
jgi:hypothetical protein